MKHNIHAKRSIFPVPGLLLLIAAAAIVTMFSGVAARAQNAMPTPTPSESVSPTSTPQATPSPAPTRLMPFIKDLQGVPIGMPRKEVEKNLGSAKVSDKAGLYYEFSKTHSAQIGFDADSNVRTVALIFTGGDKSAPAFADVFGADVSSSPNANGGIYKMVRYPEAGFWVSYSVTNPGPQATTVVTMRRMLK
ncbi:MAG: hypothetical protein ABJA02_01045 [Acidobacteriota bacterium]